MSFVVIFQPSMYSSDWLFVCCAVVFCKKESTVPVYICTKIRNNIIRDADKLRFITINSTKICLRKHPFELASDQANEFVWY